MLVLLAACSGGGPIKKDETPEDDTGTASGVPNVVVSTTDIDFGGAYLGETLSESILLQNNGRSKLTISGISVDAPFSTTFGSRLEINAGTSTSLTIKYRPTDYTRDTSTMVITSDDPDEPSVDVTLTGAVITDEDNDGFDSEDAGGYDCDDTDESVHPEADDTWYDGVDADCAGDSDYDQDGDGYESSVYNADPDRGGADCIDINAEVHPGATEIWYDGVDTDCAGDNDYDQDGDGDAAEPKGHDCDDTDAEANTDAVERFNLKDDNCDGDVDLDVAAWSADLTYTGSATNGAFGAAIALGDIDGDDLDDILVGATLVASSSSGGPAVGGVAVFTSDALPTDGSTLSDATSKIYGATANEKVGSEVVFLDDCTGDGSPDVAIGASGSSASQGRVYVVSASKLSSGSSISAASSVIITGASGSSYIGESLASNLDLNGDGVLDLAGTYAVSTTTPYIWLNYGDTTTGTIGLASVDARYSTDGKDDVSRTNFPSTGDLNGDGYTDLVYCDQRSAASGYTAGGAVWVLWGKADGYSNTSAESMTTASFVAVGGAQNNNLGAACSAGPDVTGDGIDELWFYAGSDDLKGIYGIAGMADWSAMLDTTDASVFYDMSTSHPDVLAIRDAGDIDGDDLHEMAVSISSDSSSVPGRVWVYPGSVFSGTLSAEEDALATIEGDTDYDQGAYGAKLPAQPGDVDGDTHPDWVAGDAEYSSTKGAIYLTFSPGW